MQPSKPPGRYLIGSYVKWWQLTNDCWIEPKLSGVWVCPRTPGVDVARLDIGVVSRTSTARFTSPYEATTESLAAMGYHSTFAGTDRRLVMTKTEGTAGFTGDVGWWGAAAGERQGASQPLGGHLGRPAFRVDACRAGGRKQRQHAGARRGATQRRAATPARVRRSLL